MIQLEASPFFTFEFISCWHIVCQTKNKQMEKRIFGIILTILGLVGLIYAAITFVDGSVAREYKSILVYGILGLIFFFAGIGLIRSTKDKAT